MIISGFVVVVVVVVLVVFSFFVVVNVVFIIPFGARSDQRSFRFI